MRADFHYGYNETGRPIKATICLIVGLAYTLAFATLTIGHLNILTMTFVPMLIGLAIDFGVHLVTRYEEELRHGKTKEARADEGDGVHRPGNFHRRVDDGGRVSGDVAHQFQGHPGNGADCGGGLLVCFVPMMTLLPVMLLRGRQNVMDHKIGEVEHRARIENLWLQRPVHGAGDHDRVCVLAATQIPKVYFDYNLLKMQSAACRPCVYGGKAD